MSQAVRHQVDIVSAEAEIFSGQALMVVATGIMGELGIVPNHAPLLTKLKPGLVRVKVEEDDERVFYVSGGLLEVQPNAVSVLADTVVRAEDIDEAAAKEARDNAQRELSDRKSKADYAKVAKELAEATAQMQAITKLHKKYKS